MAKIIKTGKEQKKIHITVHKKQLMIILGIVVCLGILVSLLATKPWRNVSISSKPTPAPVTSQPTKQEYADNIVQKGDYAGGQEYLDKEFLEKATTDKSRVEAYLYKARLALNAKKYDEATSFAQTADKLQSSRSTLNMLALVSMVSGDKPQAIEYFKKMLATYSNTERATQKGSLEYHDIEDQIGDLQR